MKNKDTDDYVDEFYNMFEFTSDERAKRYPMLMKLYDKFIKEIQAGDKNYRLMRKTKYVVEKAIKATCTKEQMQLIDCSQYPPPAYYLFGRNSYKSIKVPIYKWKYIQGSNIYYTFNQNFISTRFLTI